MTNQDIIPENLRFEQFEPLVGQNFSLEFKGETFNFMLAEANLSRHAAPDPTIRTGFSLQFHSQDMRPLPQMIHSMWHETLGHQHIFCVPVAAGAEGIIYEAVFN